MANPGTAGGVEFIGITTTTISVRYRQIRDDGYWSTCSINWFAIGY